MKPALWRRSRAGAFLRHLPRLKHLRGTWLHRTLGDRFFGHDMWTPQRERFAAGVAIGMFFAMVPLPLQMVAAAILAFLTRVNIPAAIVCTWFSNPFTIAPLLYANYAVGSFILGKAGKPPPRAEGALELLAAAPVPILVGAAALAALAALASYPAALLAWDLVHARFLAPAPKKRRAIRQPPPAEAHPNSPGGP